MNEIFFEFPNESTIVIKRRWRPIVGILAVAFLLLVFIATIAIEARQNEVTLWQELSVGFQQMISSLKTILLFQEVGQVSNFGIDIARFCLYMVAAYCCLYLILGLFDLKGFLRRKTTVDGNNRRVELILRKDLDFHEIQAIYFRPIHRPTGGLKNTYLIALLLTDGRKHVFGECRKRVELDKAISQLSRLIGKPVEENR